MFCNLIVLRTFYGLFQPEVGFVRPLALPPTLVTGQGVDDLDGDEPDSSDNDVFGEITVPITEATRSTRSTTKKLIAQSKSSTKDDDDPSKEANTPDKPDPPPRVVAEPEAAARMMRTRTSARGGTPRGRRLV